MPRAFVTGITGQDGQYLAEFLHSQDYEVFGMVKGQNNPRAELLRDEFPFVNLVSGDLADLPSLVSAIEACRPPSASTASVASRFPPTKSATTSTPSGRSARTRSARPSP